MTPDDICREYLESDVQIKITEQDNIVVIEGTAEAILFLSKLLAAQAVATSDSFSISPFGAGHAWFASGSTRGIYLKKVKK